MLPIPSSASGPLADQAPDPGYLERYARGLLPAAESAAVEAWLATQPDDVVEPLLDIDLPGRRLTAPLADAESAGPEFHSDLPRSRLEREGFLGEGGMAVVDLARDRVLLRQVALKVLKPRQAHESLEQYHQREQAFRREAALTAGLEHPAIPPIYDVGRADGRPAFTLQRISGATLAEAVAEVVAEQGPPALALIEPFMRAVEAVAYAHAHGIVHRDLTPANCLLGAFGAVHVVDWGIACRVGEGAGTRVGTAAWMAPEQADGAPAAPTMDVFALGGLLGFLLTSREPQRVGPAMPVELAPLDHRRIPRGLAAVARRCLEPDPAKRYRDAAEVAADLQRWLDQGLTLAQQATAWEVAWLRLRRSPRARAWASAVLVVLAVVAGGWWWQERQADARARQRLERITAMAGEADLDRPEAVTAALVELEQLRSERRAVAETTALEARLRAAEDLHRRHARQAADRAALEALLARTRRQGPWPGDARDWESALTRLGIDLGRTGPVAPLNGDSDSDLSGLTAEALAWAWRANVHRDPPRAARAAQLLADGGPDAGWQALGRVLAQARFQAHDPRFPADGDGAANDGRIALAHPASAAVVTALFAPDAAVQAQALSVIAQRPGDFWPLMAAGRAALANGDPATARRLALIASGAEPDSMFPQVLLAYTALARGDDAELASATARGLAINPDHAELIGLQAVVLARAGHRSEAAALVDRLGAGHLQYHLSHRVGHPMERTVDALQAAGLVIPEAAPDLGPLVPGTP